MSIASAITVAQGKVANAYTAVSNKGGTLPATQNLSNLPTAISSIPSGGSATIDSLTITPTTSQQTITASGGTDGYSPITVNAVTSSIDSNITAGNIKKDVTILGVTGTYDAGTTPTGTLSITANGVYDVTNYASADVSVSGGGSSNLTNMYCWKISEPIGNYFKNKLVYTASSTPNIGDNAIAIISSRIDGISVTGVISSSSISVDYGTCQRYDAKDILFN